MSLYIEYLIWSVSNGDELASIRERNSQLLADELAAQGFDLETFNWSCILEGV